MSNETHIWKYASVGGAVRVKLESGADLVNLAELDRKKWTVLSCPVQGLEFDARTLSILDNNGDGRILVDEVIAASKWLGDVLKNPDDLLKSSSEMPLDAFNTKSEEGARLQKSAKQILANLGLDKKVISLEDTADNTKIFAETKFNGDGIITEASADKEDLKGLIKTAAEVTGGSTDRSGAQGVNADQIEAFYAACADFAAWKDAAGKETFPYGDNTAAALDAVNAVKAKVADFFLRCKLIRFDEAVAGTLDVNVEKVGTIAGGDLGESLGEIAGYPLARPNAEGKLELDAINPAWQGAFATLKALIPEIKKSLTEESWAAIVAKFAPYSAWIEAKKGAEVEALGLDAVKAILKEDKKAALLDLVEKDKALEQEALSIEAVDKLLHLYRDFYAFLRNYVVFSDFYAYKEGKLAMFQAGRLFIDQRSTDLCVKIIDAGKQGDISSLSGMYILYCNCVNKVTGKSFPIAAVLTDGDVDGLRAGKNAIFYDRDGVEYDATVTSIVDNPISLRQAFWAPYKKVGKWISDKIDKSAAEKNDKSMAGLTASADAATSGSNPAAAVQSSFDIAKFAGIFAALGMALGMIGQFVVALVKGAAAIPIWKLALVIIAIMLVISLPSVFITWRKLRKRDLGPVLNANGWAVNASAYVKPAFGKALTSLVKYPKLKAVDPEEAKKVRRRKCIIWTIVILLIAGGAWFGYNKWQACKAAKAEAAAAESVAGEELPVEENQPESPDGNAAVGEVENGAEE